MHVDAYRLRSLAEVDDLDLDVDLTDSVLAVEWGAGLVEQFTDSRVEVQLTIATDGEQRCAVLVPYGADWAARLQKLG